MTEDFLENPHAVQKFVDTFDPTKNPLLQWAKWTEDLEDYRVRDIIKEFDDLYSMGNLADQEKYSGEIVVRLLGVAESAEDFQYMYTTVFFGFSIHQLNVADESTDTLVANAEYLSTILWNVAQGVSKQATKELLRSISIRLNEEVGDVVAERITSAFNISELDDNLSSSDIMVD